MGSRSPLQSRSAGRRRRVPEVALLEGRALLSAAVAGGAIRAATHRAALIAQRHQAALTTRPGLRFARGARAALPTSTGPTALGFTPVAPMMTAPILATYSPAGNVISPPPTRPVIDYTTVETQAPPVLAPTPTDSGTTGSAPDVPGIHPGGNPDFRNDVVVPGIHPGGNPDFRNDVVVPGIHPGGNPAFRVDVPADAVVVPGIHPGGNPAFR